MSENSKSHVTRLLHDARAGNRGVFEELLPIVYEELKRVAARQLSKERPNHTLQATALVHEAYLRLIDQHSVDWQNRAHFFSIAAEMMRRILVNYAAGRAAKKRGEAQTHVSFDEIGELAQENQIDVLLLDDALKRLAEIDAAQARVVEMKFFGGLTNEEIAEVLGVSDSTVKREWRMAKAWLAAELT